MDFLSTYAEMAYVLAVVLATWIILTYFFSQTTEKQRIGITFLVGIILGVVWYLFIKPTPGIDKLILSLFAAMGFYKAILGQILNALNFDYNKNGFTRKTKPNDGSSDNKDSVS